MPIITRQLVQDANEPDVCDHTRGLLIDGVPLRQRCIVCQAEHESKSFGEIELPEEEPIRNGTRYFNALLLELGEMSPTELRLHVHAKLTKSAQRVRFDALTFEVDFAHLVEIAARVICLADFEASRPDHGEVWDVARAHRPSRPPPPSTGRKS